MKVTGPSGLAPAQAPRSAPARAGFSVASGGGAGSAGATAALGSVGGVAGLSALMALQGVDDPTERRRRAVRRGGGLLDRLDELKLAMLAGEAGEGALQRLSCTLREDRPGDDDQDLTSLLDQIDLRAAVELAKAEVRRGIA